MAYKAPGKAFRTGISVLELMDMFPDEESARTWFANVRWPDGEPHCPRCGSDNTTVRENRKPMPFHCGDCRKYFSEKTGTVMEASNIPLRKWVFAIYLLTTGIKGVSSMKLHRDLGVTQKTAWFMAQRIREGWIDGDYGKLGAEAPVEVDETYIGGKETNKHASKKLHAGRGTVGKATVMGARQRDGHIKARPLGWEPGETLAGFVLETVEEGATVYTDDHRAYKSLKEVYDHGTVKHGVGEYVDGEAHTNGCKTTANWQ